MKILRIVLVVCTACHSAPPADEHVAAAEMITRRSAESRLAEWKLRARAAGKDCTILVIETPAILQDSMVRALQYGSGGDAIVPAGVQRFSREHLFRGVVYRDGSGQVWTFGDISAAEEECRR